MADIKQAAKWMQEGKKVRRLANCDEGSFFCCGYTNHFIHYQSRPLGRAIEDAMETDDLLADDWVIAE